MEQSHASHRQCAAHRAGTSLTILASLFFLSVALRLSFVVVVVFFVSFCRDNSTALTVFVVACCVLLRLCVVQDSACGCTPKHWDIASTKDCLAGDGHGVIEYFPSEKRFKV
jgi:hypothetical protein